MEKDLRPSSNHVADVRTSGSPALTTHTVRRWFIGWLVVLSVVIVPAVLGQLAPLVIYLMFSPFAVLAIKFTYLRRARQKERQMAEDEFDAEWEHRRQDHESLLSSARRDYARSPSGCWRIAYGVTHMLGGPTVGQKRIIEFGDAGNGSFQALNVSGLDVPVRVIFMYKAAAQPLHMLVKMVEPALAGWHEVEFDFEVRSTNEDPQLVLWLDAENPMPPDLEELWPFQGEFLRADA